MYHTLFLKNNQIIIEKSKMFFVRWLHYNDLCVCSVFLCVNLVHHLHMLLSGNLWLSMASLVICMHIRFLCNELQKLYIKHLTYHRVVFDMEHRYPHVNHEGECLICWETFRLFHISKIKPLQTILK